LHQPYFIVVLAHSLHGRLRRIQIHQSALISAVVLLFVAAAVLAASYVRMASKVADYNKLRQEVETLRSRYQTLEKQARITGAQLASLQMLASEVSLTFGLSRGVQAFHAPVAAEPLRPSISETLEEYNFLRSAHFSRTQRVSPLLFRSNMIPALWPLEGRLMSYFGNRTDPFSGEGAFHAGVDISAPTGTPIRATADGVVAYAGYMGHYGRLVILDHGNGFETYYAHLSQFEVLPGQAVRRGEIIARSGASGRATSAHLHYEVRRNGTPVNPYPYLNGPLVASTVRRDVLF
jgi:murein DD-endopeptidase MepM/ murein hydrolase activator NlpD